MIIRIPVIPGINDDELNLQQTGKFLGSLPNVPPVELLPYHNIAEGKYAGLGKEYPIPEIQSPTPERMVMNASILQEYGLQIVS
jgi:pyruvate formate lyase activating enzyme